MKTLSAHYLSFFRTIHRQVDNKTIEVLADNAPTELSDLVRSIHRDYFDFMSSWPNDWIYGEIAKAFEALSLDCLEDITIEADTYYHQQTAWLHENGFASNICDEAFELGFSDPAKGIHSIIEWGQILARDRIYHAVNDFLEEQQTKGESQ